MDNIVSWVKRLQGYQVGSELINKACCADDIALIADTEDDLLRLIHNFHLSCLKFNTKKPIHKTKAMTISKEPLRCKLEIDGRMVEQVMEFNYLGVNISSSANLAN